MTQPENTMEMKKINAGKLRAIGYDARERTLRVEFDDGNAIDYAAVGTEVWRKLSTSASPCGVRSTNREPCTPSVRMSAPISTA